MKINRAKQKLLNGGVALGATLNWAHPGLAEFLGYLGFDCVVADAEHYSLTDEIFEGIVRAAELADTTALIRLPFSSSRLQRYMNIGAHGVQAPEVDSAEEAQAIIDSVKFAPEGHRGLGRPRASKYGLNEGGFAEFARSSNPETLIMIQIESMEAFNSLPEILKVEGVDVVLAGPVDLSQSLGFPGQADHPKVTEIVDEIVRLTNEAGKVAGLPASNAQAVESGLKRGARYFLTASSGLMIPSAREMIKTITS